MTEGRRPVLVACNEPACVQPDAAEWTDANLRLNYLERSPAAPNVRLRLPDFVCNVYHLPDRLLDLLELASYVFAADRLVKRGSLDDVEYHGWARSFKFIMRVRDYQFWQDQAVRMSLAEALRFMTGDMQYEFTFEPGHSTPRTSLFDHEDFKLDARGSVSILLFSGGLDSLAGAVERLRETGDHVCLVSHQSQAGIIRTQDRLFAALEDSYPDRLSHYRFHTSLRSVRASEETQRSRPFLYGSIAFALAYTMSQSRFFVYENGITSINFTRREDLKNARASRTTHPKTIGLLQRLFSQVAERPITIGLPFLQKTKAEVLQYLLDSGHGNLIPSAVSCSKTFKDLGHATHCGECFQCIDRRIAVYAAGADDFDDEGTYANDIVAKSISSGENKTTCVDYIRQARDFATWNVDHFYGKRLDDLLPLDGHFPGCRDEMDLVNTVYDLCNRHGRSVYRGIKRMRDLREDLFKALQKDSLLQLVSEREFLREPVQRLVTRLEQILARAFATMFREALPVNEADLNDKVNAFVETQRDDLKREHPAVSFACARVVPDHTLKETNLLIESKYIRKGTSPSKASEGIAADLTKYPSDAHILFLVYDPLREIPDRVEFKRDFEMKGRCTVLVLL